MGSSLAQTEKAVIVLVDHFGPSYLLAVDKATGRNLWKADRKSRSSWTSPIVVRWRGRDPMVLGVAVSGDSIFVRTRTRLYCVREPERQRDVATTVHRVIAKQTVAPR